MMKLREVLLPAAAGLGFVLASWARPEPEVSQPGSRAPVAPAVENPIRTVLAAGRTEPGVLGALPRLPAFDPEAFLERIERDRAAREAADAKIFPWPGELPPEERAALLEMLWSMALGGRRSAAELIGRFEVDDPFLERMTAFLRSTGDMDLAMHLVRGLRECPSNLKRAAPTLAVILRSLLEVRDEPEFLGGLADVARLGGEGVRTMELFGFLGRTLDPRRSEAFRLHAVEGLAAWPAEGTAALLAWYPAESSPRVREGILRIASRGPEGQETLLEAIRIDPDADVRRFAAESTRLCGDRRSVSGLALLLPGETDPRVLQALRDSIAILSRTKPRR